MAVLKLALCFLLVVLCVEFSRCASVKNSAWIDNSVTILESQDMTARMQLDAVEVLKSALDDGSITPCKTLSEYFMETYDGYHWHCVNYNSYFVHRDKKIILAVGDKKYLLFSTIKH